MISGIPVNATLISFSQSHKRLGEAQLGFCLCISANHSCAGGLAWWKGDEGRRNKELMEDFYIAECWCALGCCWYSPEVSELLNWWCSSIPARGQKSPVQVFVCVYYFYSSPCFFSWLLVLPPKGEINRQRQHLSWSCWEIPNGKQKHISTSS